MGSSPRWFGSRFWSGLLEVDLAERGEGEGAGWVADSDGVRIGVWVVARPGHPLTPLTRHVRSAVAATVERMLGLRLESVTVTVDGVGG